MVQSTRQILLRSLTDWQFRRLVLWIELFLSKRHITFGFSFQVGVNAYHTIMPLLDKMIVVKEEWIALAILRLVEQEKCVVEGISR